MTVCHTHFEPCKSLATNTLSHEAHLTFCNLGGTLMRADHDTLSCIPEQRTVEPKHNHQPQKPILWSKSRTPQHPPTHQFGPWHAIPCHPPTSKGANGFSGLIARFPRLVVAPPGTAVIVFVAVTCVGFGVCGWMKVSLDLPNSETMIASGSQDEASSGDM